MSNKSEADRRQAGGRAGRQTNQLWGQQLDVIRNACQLHNLMHTSTYQCRTSTPTLRAWTITNIWILSMERNTEIYELDLANMLPSTRRMTRWQVVTRRTHTHTHSSVVVVSVCFGCRVGCRHHGRGEWQAHTDKSNVDRLALSTICKSIQCCTHTQDIDIVCVCVSSGACQT